MSRLRFEVSVNDNRIPEKIDHAIQTGMKRSGEELKRKGRMVAQTRIQQRGYIWKGELMQSFETSNEKVGTNRKIQIKNVADHAAPVEYGATYTSRGPPISALLPWVMSKFGGRSPEEFSGGGDGGGGAVLRTEADEATKGDWSKVSRDSLNTRDYFVGQNVSLLDQDGDLIEAKIYEINVAELVIMLDDGRTLGISFDNDNDFFTLVARQNWSDFARTDQLGFINSEFSDIPFLNVDPKNSGYYDLSDADRAAIIGQWDSLVQRTEWTEGYLRAAQQTDQIAALPIINKSGNRNALGHVAGVSSHPSSQNQTIGFRDFINNGSSHVNFDQHIDTYSHEFKHALLRGSGIHYHPTHYHKDQPASRGTLFDWKINADGTTDNPLLHSDPVLFALHSEDDYDIDTNAPAGDPPGWEKTVREAGDYLDSLDQTEFSDPDATDWLNPENPRISSGDNVDVFTEESLYPDKYWFHDSDPIDNGDGTWSFDVDGEDGLPTTLDVDSDGNLINGNLEFVESQSSSIDTSQSNVQQYLETNMDADPVTAYREAVNRTFFTHVVARDRESGTSNTELSDRTKLFDGYGMTNTQETAAVMHEIMNTEVTNTQSDFYKANHIQGIAETHPYLLRTWLNLFSPSDVAAGELRSIGVDF